MTEDELKTELGRAYRALRGFYGRIAHGDKPNDAMIGYHSLTLAAAMRFVDEDALDGSEYFIGKDVSELHKYLGRYGPEATTGPAPIVGSEAPPKA